MVILLCVEVVIVVYANLAVDFVAFIPEHVCPMNQFS